MSDVPACPQCNSEYGYDDGRVFVCPECGHEWAKDAAAAPEEDAAVVTDANGNTLQDGDTVIMQAYGEQDGVRIGFGEARTTILPAHY